MGDAAKMLTLRLFGPPDVRVNGEPMGRLRTRKGLWLLALLALRPGREVERAHLAGVLWPETEESQALTYLRQSLTDLRRALGPEAAQRLRSPSARTLTLDITGADADVALFDACIRRGDPESLERAAALYRGPLLEGCAEEWVLQEREARQQAYLGALEALAAAALAAGDAPAAARRLRLVLSADPMRESACRALMEALAATGDYAAVTQAFRDLRLRLRREINSEPGGETQALFDRLRADARRRAAGSPSAEAGAAEAAAARVPPPPPSPPPGRLPRPLSGFIGREREVEEVGRCLASSRLVTLTGFGGVGKTRLALRVAETAADDFPDGAWFVDLAPLSDPDLVPQAVAGTLDVAESPGRPFLRAVIDHLRTRNLLLLILDNCEHVLQASADLADALLRECPGLRILATSRQRLGVTGETERRVPPLALPDLGRLPPPAAPTGEKDAAFVLMDFEAVRLFVERARRVRPDLRLDDATLRTIADICVRLDGIPLAIELAAARMKVLGPEQFAERLSDRFHLLTGGDRAALPRQQTLRALIDWSYDLLPEEEKTLFRRLSVFAGGWTLEAAESVCAGGEGLDAWEVLDGLAGLVERSLVITEPGAAGGGVLRYRLLETVRQYAAEKLRESSGGGGEGEEAAQLRGRHRDYFNSFCRTAFSELFRSEQRAWFDRLEVEHDNLRAALAWCLEGPGGAEAGLRLCISLQPYWSLRGHLTEGRAHVRAALARAAADDAVSGLIRSGALVAAGNLATEQGDYAEARSLFEEALVVRRELGDVSGVSAALNNLGQIALDQGDYTAATSFLEQALAINRERDNPTWRAYNLGNLGVIAYRLGNYAAARAYSEESMAIHRERGNRLHEASDLNNLARVATAQGDEQGAWDYAERALAINRELGIPAGESGDLDVLGRVAQRRGDYALAHSLYAGALRMRRGLATKEGILASLESLASLRAEQGGGHEQHAAILYGAAQALRESIGAPLPPRDREEYERDVAALREALGEERFAAAWADGRALSLERAMDVALREVP